MQYKSVVLIGMPSCGKTTLGNLLAEKCQLDFYDSDEIIQQKYGNISDIFSNNGEEVFRDYEQLVIQEISQNTNSVIATGGGTILRKENITNLKEYGYIVWINRDLELLEPSNDRPLATDKSALKHLFLERKELYEMYCDEIVENNSTIEDAVKKLAKIVNKLYECDHLSK